MVFFMALQRRAEDRLVIAKDQNHQSAIQTKEADEPTP